MGRIAAGFLCLGMSIEFFIKPLKKMFGGIARFLDSHHVKIGPFFESDPKQQNISNASPVWL